MAEQPHLRVVLIVDDAFVRALVRKFLERDLPTATLRRVKPREGEMPDANFDWSRSDVLLLGHELTDSLNALDWLAGAKVSKELPPIVYVTDTGNDELARRARALGASAVLRKDELAGDALAQTLRQVVAQRQAETQRTSLSAVAKPFIDGYKLASQIGEGAKSRVYLAERLHDGQTVVLKIIDVDLVNEHAYVKRFVEEAELVLDLKSPYVVRVFDHGFTDECGYMAMEFFPRGDLKHRIEIGITPVDAVHCLANVAYGLQAIHAVGIVHRDLKPANVMFRHDDTLALGDFGISQRLASESDFHKTRRVLGTPHYMSPEQGQGKQVDVRNDIYSLGVMFYEMLTGDKPYRGATPAALVYQHIHSPIPILHSKLRRYQPLLEKLLAKDPGDRFKSADELLAEL